MKYVQVVVSLALFGWFGYALLTQQTPFGDGGSSKTRRVTGLIRDLVESVGPENAAYLCFLVGGVLAAYFLVMGEE